MNLLVRENDRILLANLFNTTKSGFLQRLLQSLGAFNQARGEATFQRFQVRQQYPTVFLHAPFTARSPSHPACLRFTILVQQNNVRETRADMSKPNHSHKMRVRPDVRGLFSMSVGSFSGNVGLSRVMFSFNVGMSMRCYRAG
jgi:hypothetical protein